MHTIFFYAVYQKNTQLVINLLENFADAILFIQNQDVEGRNIAHHFAEAGLLEAIDYIAQKPNLAIFLTKPDKKACTPFICAVLNNQTEIVNYFIQHGYANFASIAHESAFSGEFEKIKCLHQEKQLDSKDSLQVDVLAYAVSAGKIAVVNFLIENHVMSDYPKYPQLFMMAVELKHYKIAEIVFNQLHYLALIQQIPKLTKLLASEKSHDVIAWIHALITEKMRIPDAIVSHHPYFITGAIVNDTLPVFSFFIETFFTDKIYTQSPTAMDNIFILIDEYKRLRFIKALVNAFYPVAQKNPILTFQACYQIIELNNPFFLDIFLHEIKNKDPEHIKKTALQTNLKILVNNLFETQDILNLLVLNQHLSESKPQKNVSKSTRTYFEKINSTADYAPVFVYYTAHYEFLHLANQILNQSNIVINDYARLSKILYEYKMMPDNDFCVAFTEMAVDSLMLMMKKKSSQEPIDWEFLKKIYSDIQYLTLTGQFRGNALAVGLKKLIKLAFIFSDHAYIKDSVTKILNAERASGTSVLTIQLVNLYLCQICSIFIVELSFYPSNEIKKILLQEYLFIGDASHDWLFGIYLLSFIPLKMLSPKVNRKLFEKLSSLDIGKENNDTHAWLLSHREIFPMIQSVQIIQYGFTQLIQWIDKIQIEKQHCFPVQDHAEQSLQSHIQTLQSYKMHYQMKIYAIEMIRGLFEKLSIFLKKITLFIEPTAFDQVNQIDHLLSKLNELKKSFFASEMGQTSLAQYSADLSMLCAAHLIAEEDLARYRQLKKQEKRQKTETIPKQTIAEPVTATTDIKESPRNNLVKSVTSITDNSSNSSTRNRSSLLAESTEPNNLPWMPANKKKPIIIANATPGVNHKKINPHINQRVRHSLQPLPLPIVVKAIKKKSPIQPKNYHLLKKTIMTSAHQSSLILTPEMLQSCGFSIDLPQAVNRFFACFLSNQLFLVGGAIRNALTAKKINDFDFVAFMAMDKIKQQFKNYYRIEGHGKKHIIVITYEHYQFNVLVIESQTYQEALLHGSITIENVPVLLKQEYQKRDFSINALYFNPSMGVIDVCGGLMDLLCHRRLRPVWLDSAHFEFQHSIRILRGLRFAVQFTCVISAELRCLMLQNIHFLYTVTKTKLEKEYKNLVNLLGHAYAYQLYRHYYLSDLLVNRGISLIKPTWQTFWQHGSISHPHDQKLNNIGQTIKNYLPKKALVFLALTSRHYYRFFNIQKKTDVTPKSQSVKQNSKKAL